MMVRNTDSPTARSAATSATSSDRSPAIPHWEYLIIALPRFEEPTNVPGASAAVQRLNDVGSSGWEAVGMTALADGSIAVLCKRPRGDWRKRRE